jgi:hypothetical protein
MNWNLQNYCKKRGNPKITVKALRKSITNNNNADFTFEEIRKYDPPGIFCNQQQGNLGFSKSFSDISNFN